VETNTANDVNDYGGSWYSLYAIGDKLYAIDGDFGGLVSFDTSSLNNSWVGVETSNVASSVSVHGGWLSLCAIGSKLYAIEKQLGQLVVLDTSTDTKSWSKIGTNTARSANGNSGYWHSLCAIGNKLYAIDKNSGQLMSFFDTPYYIGLSDIEITLSEPTRFTTAGGGIGDIWLDSSGNSGIICFHGKGELEVTVTPNPGTISYTNAGEEVASTSITNTAGQTHPHFSGNSLLRATRGRQIQNHTDSEQC
jgi:hypothetical protein